MIRKYLKLKKYYKNTIEKAELVGGKIKRVNFDYITERDEIETIELTYGFEVRLTFYNNEEKFKAEVEKNKKRELERLEIIKKQSQRKDESVKQKTECTETICTEKQLENEKNTQDDKRLKTKKNAKIGVVISILLFIISIYIMPYGIVTMTYSMFSFIINLCLIF